MGTKDDLNRLASTCCSRAEQLSLAARECAYEYMLNEDHEPEELKRHFFQLVRECDSYNRISSELSDMAGRVSTDGNPLIGIYRYCKDRKNCGTCTYTTESGSCLFKRPPSSWTTASSSNPKFFDPVGAAK